MIILNIFLPGLILLEVFITKKYFTKKLFYLVNALMFLMLAILSMPIILTGYNYSNWILDYLKVPFLLTSIALFLTGFIIYVRNNKLFLIIVFSITFLLNILFQALTMFGSAFGGGNYPSKYNHHYNWEIGDYKISHFWKQGFAGPPYHQYVIDKTALKGLVYKEIARTTENDTSKCEVTFYKHMGREAIIFNKCNMTIRYDKEPY